MFTNNADQAEEKIDSTEENADTTRKSMKIDFEIDKKEDPERKDKTSVTEADHSVESQSDSIESIKTKKDSNTKKLSTSPTQLVTGDIEAETLAVLSLSQTINMEARDSNRQIPSLSGITKVITLDEEDLSMSMEEMHASRPKPSFNENLAIVDVTCEESDKTAADAEVDIITSPVALVEIEMSPSSTSINIVKEQLGNVSHKEDGDQGSMQEDILRDVDITTNSEPLLEVCTKRPAVKKTVTKPKLKRKKKRVPLNMPKSYAQSRFIDCKYKFETYSKARAYKNSPANLKLRKMSTLSQAVITSSAKRKVNKRNRGAAVRETPLSRSRVVGSSSQRGSITTGGNVSGAGSEVAKRLEMTPTNDDDIGINDGSQQQQSVCTNCSTTVVDVTSQTPEAPDTPIEKILCQQCVCALNQHNRTHVFTKKNNKTTNSSPHRSGGNSSRLKWKMRKLSISKLVDQNKSNVTTKAKTITKLVEQKSQASKSVEEEEAESTDNLSKNHQQQQQQSSRLSSSNTDPESSKQTTKNPKGKKKAAKQQAPVQKNATAANKLKLSSKSSSSEDSESSTQKSSILKKTRSTSQCSVERKKKTTTGMTKSSGDAKGARSKRNVTIGSVTLMNMSSSDDVLMTRVVVMPPRRNLRQRKTVNYSLTAKKNRSSQQPSSSVLPSQIEKVNTKKGKTDNNKQIKKVEKTIPAPPTVTKYPKRGRAAAAPSEKALLKATTTTSFNNTKKNNKGGRPDGRISTSTDEEEGNEEEENLLSSPDNTAKSQGSKMSPKKAGQLSVVDEANESQETTKAGSIKDNTTTSSNASKKTSNMSQRKRKTTALSQPPPPLSKSLKRGVDKTQEEKISSQSSRQTSGKQPAKTTTEKTRTLRKRKVPEKETHHQQAPPSPSKQSRISTSPGASTSSANQKKSSSTSSTSTSTTTQKKSSTTSEESDDNEVVLKLPKGFEKFGKKEKKTAKKNNKNKKDDSPGKENEDVDSSQQTGHESTASSSVNTTGNFLFKCGDVSLQYLCHLFSPKRKRFFCLMDEHTNINHYYKHWKYD